ncbi:MAG: hypothetical protein HY744_22450 [Deltaproteobacteria bacterium]|nr:hypothetical protein [Deltaproteobacteria bacterium]
MSDFDNLDHFEHAFSDTLLGLVLLASALGADEPTPAPGPAAAASAPDGAAAPAAASPAATPAPEPEPEPGGFEYWLGGAASVLGGAAHEHPVTGALGCRELELPGLGGQAELDVRLAWKWLYARFDLDLRPFYPAAEDAEDAVLASGRFGFAAPFGPEWAMLQLGRDSLRARLGVTNPAMGLEDWDEWNNYFPTRSIMFEPARPGRLLGAEPSYGFESGPTLFAFGGYDLDFEDPMVGAGITTEQDAWATWSGVAFYPTVGFYSDAWYGTAVVAFEIYPFAELSIALDGQAGLLGPEACGAESCAPFVGGQLVLSALPEAVARPVVRIEALLDPDETLGGAEAGVPTISASAGLKLVPAEWLSIALEGKTARVGDAMAPALFGAISVFRPEPPPDATRAPEAEQTTLRAGKVRGEPVHRGHAVAARRGRMAAWGPAGHGLAR